MNPINNAATWKTANFCFRLLVAVAAVYFVFSKLDRSTILPLLSSMKLPCLIAALLLKHLSQLVVAQRMRYYLSHNQISLSFVAAVRLNYVSWVFGTFLPGGVASDVYKAWWLTKKENGRLFNTGKILVAGRFNGLWAMGVVICLIAALDNQTRALFPYSLLWICAALITGTVIYRITARRVFAETSNQLNHASLYSLVSQSIFALIAYVLSIGLGETSHALSYVMLIMISGIVVTVPISLGGVGIRELSLLYGSRFLSLSQESGVALSLAYTLVSLTVPLVGAIVYQTRNSQPRNEQKPS